MVRLQDDFYAYVNGKWAETAVIPDDKPSTGGFMDLIQDIELDVGYYRKMAKRRRIARRQYSAKLCQIPQDGGRF